MSSIQKSHIAALSISVKSSSEIQLLPAGEFRSRDGRPAKVKSWKIDSGIAAKVIALAAARQTPFVIDYEHQTLLSEDNGQPAPAAGWFKALEWREGDGLYATDVDWTDKAKAMIDAREYRFLSPVFAFDKTTGAVNEINHAALTNVPALDGMAELAVMSAYALRFLSDQPTTEEPTMDLLSKLLGAIGLAATTSEADALSAVAALKTKADQVTGLQTELVALKTKEPDPEKFVSVDTMKDLQAQVASLSTKLNGQELDVVIDDALKGGKLLPAQEVWARTLGGKDIASLKTYLESAPKVMPTQTQTDGKEPNDGKAGKLTDEEQAVCKNLGISAEEFLKNKVAV
jgi:phage I-like protein